ncbi:glutathione S-transferase family protein [Roseomonas marmotae]|uniref:Glutathione S-transferase N-terminal domain-containing protein n=1 Tax=Roseomonas marmotae TaxID=2768161 RepID=A0ABS3KBH3_9PROT|nr:glutathione S-transferase N-terminal domain-containing protein [Roseomonas marmotae]MBO1073998.1 glutathione S-transferase N-terminal domain-containing protein [Roseomonas marmotae]QTI78786.1 glutathione S-transferase N-terminal domain-containing protein [Roseomonas marmotae]
MKLFYSATSPYVRKVVLCAMLRGLDDRIERIETNPHVSPPELLASNPLSKVPCLLTVEGMAIYDSPVICEYLDGFGTARGMFPAELPERIPALVMQALADGIMDAAVGRRLQQPWPQDEGRQAADGRARAAIGRALDQLEAAPPRGLHDIGAVSTACALGYLDFRFGQDPWREGRPKLAAWFAEVSAHEAMRATAPA